MPTYEYRCAEGHTFEQIQKMNEPAITECPVCGAPAARVISGGQGVIFKGSGFYITDYGKDGKGPRKDTEGAPAAAAEAKGASPGDAGAAKPDSKPDSKPDPKPGPKPDKKAEPAAPAAKATKVDPA